jgi:hypothetical protein
MQPAATCLLNNVTLIVLISMFDFLLDGFLGLIDLAVTLLHLLIEAIEYMLELLLVYTLHTSTQQSETIIVNATIIIALYLTYRLLLNIPQLYRPYDRCWNIRK